MGLQEAAGAGVSRGRREAAGGRRQFTRSVWTLARAVILFASLLPLPASRAQTRLVVISGLAGEPKYAESFHAWSNSLVDAARSRYGLADSSIVWLAESPGKAPGRIAGRSSKEAIERTLDGLAARMRSGEQLVVVLIGHGSVQGDDGARLTLPGPDLSAADLARLLARHGSRRVAVIVAASSSGDFVPALSAPGRVVITATKSGFERNESLFGGHFVAALAGDGADADKDGRVSLLEAFTYATREVRRAYEQENRLLTEHALLDDNGDRSGSGEPGAAAKDGALARSFFLTAGAATAGVSNDPRAAALRKEKEELESKIEALKARRDAMDAKAYEAELERLLVDLAATTRALRALEGRPQ
jgi:hypothetical protein